MISYASMDSPEEMTSLLFRKLPVGVNKFRVEQAHAFMRTVHEGQPRGNRGIPFIVHPLAVGLLLIYLVSKSQQIRPLLHCSMIR